MVVLGGTTINSDGSYRLRLRTFVKDSFKPRKWLTSNLRKVSRTTSNVIGQGAKWAGRGLVALGAWQNGKDFYDEPHDVGRAISYSAVSTGIKYLHNNFNPLKGGVDFVGDGINNI